MLRLANRWTVDTLDTFVVFRLELKSSKKFIYHFFLFNGGVSNAADPDELSSFGMLKDLTVFVFNSTTQPVDGHWKHDMNGKENRIRGLVSWLHNEFLLILAGCWKYSRVETFLVTLRESDLMGLPVDRVAVPANIVKSHGKWCCNCQRKHNLPHVVDIHEIHNLLSMQWPLHQISVFIMGNMDCVMPSSPCLNLDSFSWRFDMFKFKRLPVSYHRNPPLTSVVLNPASVDLRCFARQCRDMSRVVISFCGLALATGPRLSQWGPGWHRGPNTHKSRLPPHTLQFLLASRYSKQHCIDIK